MKHRFGIAIHGGAGTISKGKMSRKKELVYTQALEEAVDVGYKALARGYSAVQAVTKAVMSLEDCPLFNAGRGSVFNYKGEHEMDACIMNGQTMDAGAVAGINYVKNPIRMAGQVMKKSKHVLLSGDLALEFARKQGLELVDNDYFYVEERYKQYKRLYGKQDVSLDHDDKYGTVGAVALDQHGNLAAATSTGGMTNKRYGRIGDTPIVGAGTYAENNICAISCTGHGEYFLRLVVAHEIRSLMKYKDYSLQRAIKQVVQKDLPKIGGRGGVIGIDYTGKVVLDFNTKGMYRGYRSSDGKHGIGIFR